MHVTQVHPVTTENQFHCTRLYATPPSLYVITVQRFLCLRKKGRKTKKRTKEEKVREARVRVQCASVCCNSECWAGVVCCQDFEDQAQNRPWLLLTPPAASFSKYVPACCPTQPFSSTLLENGWGNPAEKKKKSYLPFLALLHMFVCWCRG